MPFFSSPSPFVGGTGKESAKPPPLLASMG
jgi:hypothetical protein